MTCTRAPKIQLTPTRKRVGHPDLPSSALVRMWTGARAANSPNAHKTRAIARPFGLRLAIAVEGDAVQLHPMVNEAKPQLLGDSLLQGFEILVDEFDDVAGFDVD